VLEVVVDVRDAVYPVVIDPLATSAGWSAESDQGDAYFGYSVGTAGDVNGDGYSDVIVGSPYYDNGQVNEGRAFGYYGNAGPGKRLNPRQFNYDGSSPVAPLGRNEDSTSLALAALGRTLYERAKVKLEWEVNPYGIPFDRLGTQKSASRTVTETAGVELQELATGLSVNTLYPCRNPEPWQRIKPRHEGLTF
jgi:hypothetical protein